MNIFERIMGSEKLEQIRYDKRAESKLKNLKVNKLNLESKNDSLLNINWFGFTRTI